MAYRSSNIGDYNDRSAADLVKQAHRATTYIVSPWGQSLNTEESRPDEGDRPDSPSGGTGGGGGQSFQGNTSPSNEAQFPNSVTSRGEDSFNGNPSSSAGEDSRVKQDEEVQRAGAWTKTNSRSEPAEAGSPTDSLPTGNSGSRCGSPVEEEEKLISERDKIGSEDWGLLMNFHSL
jgi:hypothetical protein